MRCGEDTITLSPEPRPQAGFLRDAARFRTIFWILARAKLFHIWTLFVRFFPNRMPIGPRGISSLDTLDSSILAPGAMSATPSPPPSPAPNFTNPYSIAKGLNAVGILCTTLTTFTTAIRLYTKLYIIKTHGWEDCRKNSMCYRTFIISGRVNWKADTMLIAWVTKQSLLAALHELSKSTPPANRYLTREAS